MPGRLARQPSAPPPQAPHAPEKPQPGPAPAPAHVPWAQQTTTENSALAEEIDKLDRLSGEDLLVRRVDLALRASVEGRDHAHDVRVRDHAQDVRALEAIEFLAARRAIAPLTYVDPYKHSDQHAVQQLNVRLAIEGGIQQTGSLKKAIEDHNWPRYVQPDIWAVEHEANEFGAEFSKQARGIALKMLTSFSRTTLSIVA